MLEHEELTGQIIAAAIEVHRILGPGLLEPAYQSCLARELSLREVAFQKELKLPIEYKGVRVEPGYRLDFIVAQTVVVECKAVESMLPVHEAQLLTYLRLTELPVGLMINFNVPVLKDGILRRVNSRSESSSK